MQFKLNLPPVIKKKSNGSYRFGFYYNIREKLNLNPMFVPTRVWEHGWHHGYEVTPNYNYFKFYADRNSSFIVPKKKIADDLYEYSNKSNKIIVAPLPFYFYIKNFFGTEIKKKKKKNLIIFLRKLHIYNISKLLVKKILNEYIEYAKEKEKYFENVILCFSPEDLIDDIIEILKISNIKYIQGVDPNDTNGYFRINEILNYAECIDTNSLGSQLVYAAAKGIKIKLWKSKYEVEKKIDIFNIPKKFDKKFIQNLEEEVNYRQSNQFINDHLGFLVTQNYENHDEWGKKEIGYNEAFRLDDVQKLLGLNFLDQLEFYKKKFKTKLKFNS